MEEGPTGTNVNVIDRESDIWPSGFYLYLFDESMWFSSQINASMKMLFYVKNNKKVISVVIKRKKKKGGN